MSLANAQGHRIYRASGADIASASLVIADDQTVLANSGEELFDLLRVARACSP